MKGEQKMRKVDLNEYAAICRASKRGNLIARLKVRNVEVNNEDNELVKLVVERLKREGDFFEEICCSDPNVGTTAIGQWAESVWKAKGRMMDLSEIRNGNFEIMGFWVFAKNSFEKEKEDLLEEREERFIRSLARLMNDLKEEAEKLGINVRKGMILDSIRFSI